MKSIANANQLKNWNELYIGQNLLIPNVYTVKPGDSLYGVAKKLGVTMVELAGENNLSDWNNLYVGQELKLPEEDDIDTERYLEPTAKKFPNTFYYKGGGDRPQVALTFDDGPYNFYTEKVLDILKAHNVKATFFILGQNIGGKQRILQRMISEGHTVANHTWTHPNLSKLSEQQVTTEITKTNQMIQNAAGVVPNLIRPPYGFVSNQNLEQIQGMDNKIIKWSVDSFDWRDKNLPSYCFYSKYLYNE
jgi:peptidoglycan/xylan/chitin deacetylase (PgdA/CDA1 family)